MSYVKSFSPIAATNAKILILGSIPSRTSLQHQQYYAYPHNAFWRIMAELFDFSTDISYQQRTKILIANHIAVWDVLKACFRPGSLDSDIETQSIIPNDFFQFYLAQPNINNVFFNGLKAEQVYRKKILPQLNPKNQILYHQLPSTSPANARVSYQDKLEKWRIVKKYI